MIFADWRKAPPILVPRWALSLKYALFTVLGVVAFYAGIPTLDLTTWAGYTAIWAGALAVAAGVATVSSIRPRWERIECWAAVSITALLSAYAVAGLLLAFGGWHLGRMSFAIVLLIITILPGTRAFSMLLKTGRADG